MLKNMKYFIILVVFLICGCSEKIENMNLKHENERLRAVVEQYEKQKVEHIAKIEYQRSQASIAYACDWLIAVCPDSFVTDGREFLKTEKLGRVDEFNAQLLIFLKFILTIAAISAFIAILGRAWAIWASPAFKEAEDAKRRISEVRELEQQLQESLHQNEKRLSALEAKRHDLEREIAERLAQHEKLLDSLEKEKQEKMIAIKKIEDDLKEQQENIEIAEKFAWREKKK